MPDTKLYQVLYRLPHEETGIRRFAISYPLTKWAALNLFRTFDDAVMVLKTRGWFRRIIIQREEAV